MANRTDRDRELMPPPPLPMNSNMTSRSSSRSPLSRNALSSSCQSSIHPRSSGFSDTTKLWIKELAEDRCWACGSQPAHVCHVIAREDTQASLWSDAGLITIDISSHNNGIALCPTCRYQFDLLTDPGFVLIPTDLDFFISFELEDRERRAKEGENPRRQVPNHETYKAHQMAKGDITVEACGGLYYPIFLKEYFFQRPILSTCVLQLLEQLSKPKPWHGDPVAVLRRCFPVLGSMRSKNLSVESRKKLEELRNLYFYDNEEEGRNQPHPTPTQNNAVESNKKKHLDDTSSSSHLPTPKRPRNNGREGSQIEFCPVTRSY